MHAVRQRRSEFPAGRPRTPPVCNRESHRHPCARKRARAAIVRALPGCLRESYRLPSPRAPRQTNGSFNLAARSNYFKNPERNAVRFIVHPEVKARAPEAVAWVKEFLARFDVSLLGWLRIDFGREHRDRQGRIYYKFHGVYGRCWYPTKKQPSIRLSCQVPGPFPCAIITRKKPIYRRSDGTWPAEAKQNRGPVYCDASSQRHWKRVYAKTTVKNLNEGVVWVFAHEAFHWLLPRQW